jgi:hypothetical protein
MDPLKLRGGLCHARQALKKRGLVAPKERHTQPEAGMRTKL